MYAQELKCFREFQRASISGKPPTKFEEWKSEHKTITELINQRSQHYSNMKNVQIKLKQNQRAKNANVMLDKSKYKARIYQHETKFHRPRNASKASKVFHRVNFKLCQTNSIAIRVKHDIQIKKEKAGYLEFQKKLRKESER